MKVFKLSSDETATTAYEPVECEISRRLVTDAGREVFVVNLHPPIPAGVYSPTEEVRLLLSPRYTHEEIGQTPLPITVNMFKAPSDLDLLAEGAVLPSQSLLHIDIGTIDDAKKG